MKRMHPDDTSSSQKKSNTSSQTPIFFISPEDIFTNGLIKRMKAKKGEDQTLNNCLDYFEKIASEETSDFLLSVVKQAHEKLGVNYPFYNYNLLSLCVLGMHLPSIGFLIDQDYAILPKKTLLISLINDAMQSDHHEAFVIAFVLIRECNINLSDCSFQGETLLQRLIQQNVSLNLEIEVNQSIKRLIGAIIDRLEIEHLVEIELVKLIDIPQHYVIRNDLFKFCIDECNKKWGLEYDAEALISAAVNPHHP